MATGHFANLPITYKSLNQTSKYQKVAETKKLRLNTYKCSKFSLFYKKNRLKPQKKKKTAKKLHFLEHYLHFLGLMNGSHLLEAL